MAGESDEYLPSISSAAEGQGDTDNSIINVSDKKNLIADISGAESKKGQSHRCMGCSYIIEPLMIIFMLVNYPLYYMIPEYIRLREWESLTGNSNYNKSESKCSSSMNQTVHIDPTQGNMTLASSAASYFDLEMTLVQTIPAVFAVIFLGPFSDKAGRKYTILSPIIGQTFAAVSCTATAAFHLPIELILVGCFLYGCTGLYASFYSGCFSYISDITSVEKRSFRLVLAMLSLLISSTLSTAGTGYLVDCIGFAWVFLSMLMLNILTIPYVIFLVPETIKREGKVKFFSYAYIKKSFTVVLLDDATKRRWKLLVVLAALFTERLVSGASSIDTLFAMSSPLCWGTDLVGIFSSARHAFSIVVSGISMWCLKSYVRDEWWCIMSGLSTAAAFLFRFFVKTTIMMFASGALDFAGPFFATSIRSMLTKLVQSDEIGAIMGGVAILELLATMFGHMITNPLFAATERTGHPSTVYLVMGGVILVSTFVICVYAYLTRAKNTVSVKQSQAESIN